MKTLAVLGSGMQGVAAAYDAAKYGNFERILLADCEIANAISAVERVNTLLDREICEPARFDAAHPSGLSQFLERVDVAIGALPYRLHPLVADVAIRTGCSFIDMGIDTEYAIAILERSPEAKAKGIAVVTDCGLAPGLVNVFARDLIERHPTSTHVRAYCGGLPERPVGPLGYVLRFSMESVVGEYSEEVLALQDGRIAFEDPLEKLETLEFNGVGMLEAFTTSGGTGTAPYAFQGKVPNYEYKTLRYPGHAEAMRLFRNCGFWSEEFLPSLGISPRQAFCAVLEGRLRYPEVADIVVVRVEAEGPDGLFRLEMLERHDPITGFTAMERLTGFGTSIVALEVAAGRVAPGCYGCETAVDPKRFLEALGRRGFTVSSREEVVTTGGR